MCVPFHHSNSVPRVQPRTVLVSGTNQRSMEITVAGTADKVADAIKAGGATAKQAAAKVHDVVTDPVVQEKARKLAEIGERVYRTANSPEAKKAYSQVAAFLKKTRKK
jgi:hypothetical protein